MGGQGVPVGVVFKRPAVPQRNSPDQLWMGGIAQVKDPHSHIVIRLVPGAHSPHESVVAVYVHPGQGSLRLVGQCHCHEVQTRSCLGLQCRLPAGHSGHCAVPEVHRPGLACPSHAHSDLQKAGRDLRRCKWHCRLRLGRLDRRLCLFGDGDLSGRLFCDVGRPYLLSWGLLLPRDLGGRIRLPAAIGNVGNDQSGDDQRRSRDGDEPASTQPWEPAGQAKGPHLLAQARRKALPQVVRRLQVRVLGLVVRPQCALNIFYVAVVCGHDQSTFFKVNSWTVSDRSKSLIRFNARCKRLLTVPSLKPRARAISGTVSSEKYRRTTAVESQEVV